MKDIKKSVHLKINQNNLNNIKMIAAKRGMLQQDLINQLLEYALNKCEEMKIIKEFEKNIK